MSISRVPIKRFTARDVTDFLLEIPPAPQFPIEAVLGDKENRASAISMFNEDMRKWRENLAQMPGALAKRSKQSASAASDSTMTVVSTDTSSIEASVAATLSQVNKVLSGPYHRFKADGTFQLKNPNTGYYHTVLGFDGYTVSVELAPEA